MDIKKAIKKLGKDVVQNKAIVKKQQGTVVFKREEPRSKYFKAEMERARWL